MEQVLQGLRPYTTADLDPLVRLLMSAQAWPPAARTTAADLRARWAQRNVTPEEAVNVLPGPGGELIACSQAALFKDGTPRLSFEIAVHPEHRRRGIASALYELVEHRAHDLGVTHMSSRIYYTLNQERPECSRFLDRRGFKLDSSYWQLRLDNIGKAGVPSWPPGISYRTIRETEADLQRWAELVREAFQEPASAEMVRAQLSEPGASPLGYFFAIDWGTGLEVGTSRARVDSHGGDPVGYVGTVGVTPEYRGRGIAGALIRQTLAYLVQQGLDSATLYVENRNQAARRLYDRMGWYPVYRTDNYWRRIPEAGGQGPV